MQVVGTLGLYLVAVQLHGNVGVAIVHLRIVQVALDAEVGALAQCIIIEFLVEAHVHVVTGDVCQRASVVARHTEHLRATRVLRHLNDVCLEGHLLLTILAERLSTQLIDTVLGERHGTLEPIARCRQQLVALFQVLSLDTPLVCQVPTVHALTTVLHTHT